MTTHCVAAEVEGKGRTPRGTSGGRDETRRFVTSIRTPRGNWSGKGTRLAFWGLCSSDAVLGVRIADGATLFCPSPSTSVPVRIAASTRTW